MGADKGQDGDMEPLLPTPALSPGQVAVAAEEAAGAESRGVNVRQWQGSLLQCCGNCGLVGWSSFLLTHYLPCVAFGQNMKRSLRHSAWSAGIMNFLLFLVAVWFGTAAIMAANHNVLARCNGPLPGPNDQHMLSRGLGSHHDWDDNDDDDDHHQHLDVPGHYKDDGKDGHEHDDGDHAHHKHGHGHDGDDDGDDGGHHKHKHGGHDDDGDDNDNKKDKGHLKPGKPQAPPKAKGTISADAQGAIPKPAITGSFRSVGNYLGTFNLPDGHPEPHFHHHPSHHDDLLASPECQRAVGLWIAAWVAMVLAGLVGVHYAASRRTMIRERFGIAGSKLGDFCAWFWCAPCALCQETRTLWTNNVNEGVWHGRTQYVAITPPPTVPSQQFMTA